jgi:hypothetical protein
MAIVQDIAESTQTLGARARSLYERLREKVETRENRGKLIVMDVASGDYEIDALGVESARRLQARHPGASLYALRIGYETAASFGGAPERTTPT